jgi:glutamine synthetase
MKGVPIGRLEAAAARGVGMSPVFDAFVLDDSITSSPTAGGPVGDLRLVPDVDALVPLAAQPGWAWAPVDRWTQAGDRHPQCQRTFVREMVQRLADRGRRAEMAFEVEWMVSAGPGDDFVPATSSPAYGAARAVELSDYCVELVRALEAQGIAVGQLHPEYESGQFEVSVHHADPLTAADRNVLVRQTIRAVSRRHDLRPTFAPVAEPGGVGSGMHLHLSLWRDDHNDSLGGSGPFGLTATTESFLAGVLDALPEMLAVTAPSVASYLRLQPKHWSAPFRCWGLENREAPVRLVVGSAEERGTTANAEVKAIDATASPYLAVGAVLAAGLAGLDRSASLPAPIEVDPASLSDEQRAERGIERLPTTLDAAADRFASSTLLAEAMGRDLHQTVLAVRRAECGLFADADEATVVAATRWRH